MRIAVCSTRVPFERGGAEDLAESLVDRLGEAGHESDLLTVPFAWTPRIQILKSALAWRLLSLESAAGRSPDLVISTRFPSYLVQHPNKVVWLVHQFRQVYDLLGTRYSDFDAGGRDRDLIAKIQTMDRRAFAESRKLFAISRNVADRLHASHGLEAQVLYPPPRLTGRLHPGPTGDYVFSVGRLDDLKRFDLLLDVIAATRSTVRCRIAGDGPQRAALEEQIGALGLGDRVQLLGRIPDRELIDHYAGALCVFYAPFDEDYGYVTVEAFQSAKAVVTTSDSGAVLELARDGENALVGNAEDPGGLAAAIDRLFDDRDLAATLGRAGAEAATDIRWENVLRTLTEAAGA